MVKVRPAIVALPDRAAPLFACTASFTLPLPLPDDPAATLIHGVLLDDDHGQPDTVVTATFVSPAAADIVTRSGARVKLQFSACDTVNVRPPIVNVSERSGPLLAAAVKPTVPLPVPARRTQSRANWRCSSQSNCTRRRPSLRPSRCRRRREH